MDRKTSYKLGLLATLYFSQGLPYGFFLQSLPVFLRQQGISLKAIGLTSLLALPWAIKFMWAPLVDAPHRPRKHWIVPLQALAAMTMLAAAFIDPVASLGLLLMFVFLANLLAATQDISTDGLALDLLDYHERGFGNGIQVAGYRVGMIIGGGALLILYEDLGWTLTFVTLSALLLVATIPTILHKEAPRQHDTQPQEETVEPDTKNEGEEEENKFAVLLSFLRQDRIFAWLAVLIAYKFGESLAGGMLRPFLVDMKLSVGDIGWLLGTGGFTAGLLGALLGGWFTHKLGRTRALVVFGVIQSLGVAGYLIPALGISTSMSTLYAVSMLEHFTGGLATVALFTLMMDATRPDHHATDYTIQASIVVITSGTAAALSGFVAESVGFMWLFVLSASLGLLGVLGIVALIPRTNVHLMAEQQRQNAA